MNMNKKFKSRQLWRLLDDIFEEIDVVFVEEVNIDLNSMFSSNSQKRFPWNGQFLNENIEDKLMECSFFSTVPIILRM